jgi:hypothetical protein
MATFIPRRQRRHCRHAAWSCRRRDHVRYTRLLLLLRPQLFPVRGIRLRARGFSAGGPSSIAGLLAALPADREADKEAGREAIRSARPADLPVRQGSSLADRVRSILHALRPVVMQGPADQAGRERVPALALVLALEAHHVPALAVRRVPAQVEHRLPVKHRVRRAHRTSAPAVVSSNIRRRRKAQ